MVCLGQDTGASTPPFLPAEEEDNASSISAASSETVDLPVRRGRFAELLSRGGFKFSPEPSPDVEDEAAFPNPVQQGFMEEDKTLWDLSPHSLPSLPDYEDPNAA
jgi:hypothetical protein